MDAVESELDAKDNVDAAEEDAVVFNESFRTLICGVLLLLLLDAVTADPLLLSC